jgi:hypothetical protein
MRTDRWIDMTKVIIDFGNIANAPKTAEMWECNVIKRSNINAVATKVIGKAHQNLMWSNIYIYIYIHTHIYMYIYRDRPM